MSAYGVHAHAWFPIETARGSAPIRLTRRGRAVRSLAIGVAMAALVGATGSVVLDGRARAGEGVPGAGAPTAVEVVVEEGDSLWTLAGRHAPGVDPREVVLRIRQLNGMRSNLIHPGQLVLIPSGL